MGKSWGQRSACFPVSWYNEKLHFCVLLTLREREINCHWLIKWNVIIGKLLQYKRKKTLRHDVIRNNQLQGGNGKHHHIFYYFPITAPHPSIHLYHLFVRVPAYFGREAGYNLGRSLSYRRANTERWTTIPVDLICRCLDCERKLKHPDETHACSGENVQTLTRKATSFEPSRCEVTMLNIAPLYRP